MPNGDCPVGVRLTERVEAMRHTQDQHGVRLERIEDAQQRGEVAQAGLQLRVAMIVAGIGLVGNAIAIPLILKYLGG